MYKAYQIYYTNQYFLSFRLGGGAVDKSVGPASLSGRRSEKGGLKDNLPNQLQ